MIFDQVIDGITAYQAKTKLLFVLAKVDNLVKNGRLSKLVGTVVGLLNIRMVGEASKTGTLELLQKARGQKKAIKAAFDELLKAGYAGGHITIAHRNNEKFIEQFSELVRENLPKQASKFFLLLDSVVFMLKKADSLWGMKFKLTLKRGWTTCSVF